MVLDQSVQDQEQGVTGWQRLQTVGAFVVDKHFLPGAFLQKLFAVFGGSQISQCGLALLQPLPIKPVAAVDVDGAADMVDIVGDEGPAVDDESLFAAAVALDAHGQIVGFHCSGALQKQSPLQG